jgi:SAM-dependent methyltransferase
MKIAKSIIYRIRRLFPRPDHHEVQGSIIPSPDRRWCGPEFKDDLYYIQSAEREANRLVEHFGCQHDSRVLDVGCGQGRLAIGLQRILGAVPYHGIDIDKKSILWCKKYLQSRHPSFQFNHLDLYNERYNPGGVKIDESFRFNIEPVSVDVAYLFSVFSHTTEEDMRTYLKELHRVLKGSGHLFFTTFVEENVPKFTVNPDRLPTEMCRPIARCAIRERVFVFHFE